MSGYALGANPTYESERRADQKRLGAQKKPV